LGIVTTEMGDDTPPPSDPPRETERDQAFAQRDEGATQRDVAADVRDKGGDHRDRSAQDRDAASVERDTGAEQRDEVSARRDLEGDQRDVTAAQRDQIAEQRDLVVSDDGRAGPVTNVLIVRSALARRDAASDRRRSAADRDAGSSHRNEAEQDRDAASTARLEAEHDRDAAASERTESGYDRAAGADDRAAARSARTAAPADREAPTFDELTGTYRRAAGFIELDREMARSRRMGQPLTLVAVDVEDLETVNETGGQSAGDQVLVDVADTISSIFRPYDVVIRAAEDEFVCAISGLGMEDATKRLAKVAPTLAALPGAGASSLATGFAELQPDDSREDVIARAELALHPLR
jgi:diguanylate cyclase (GGDEF)-like protein